VDKTFIYRAYCEMPYKAFVFVEAASREGAKERLYSLLSALSGRHAIDISLRNLDSWHDMIDRNVSEDRDLRIFELGWLGKELICWITKPLFLAPANNAFLLNKWAELQLQLTSNQAGTIISKYQ
jgi:hypothetical protein